MLFFLFFNASCRLKRSFPVQKCYFRFENAISGSEFPFPVWNGHFGLGIAISGLKNIFPVWNGRFRFEICISGSEWQFPVWNYHFNLGIAISGSKKTFPVRNGHFRFRKFISWWKTISGFKISPKTVIGHAIALLKRIFISFAGCEIRWHWCFSRFRRIGRFWRTGWFNRCNFRSIVFCIIRETWCWTFDSRIFYGRT